MWLLLPHCSSASIEARPTSLNSLKDAGTSSHWVHAVQPADTSNSLEVFVPPGRKIVTPAGEDIMLPEGAKAGSLVILRVPESSCIESWSESHVGGALGYAPSSGERPDHGSPDEAFVQAPSSMRAGDTFQMFVRGRPLEVTTPES